jgi:hypothetical protein
MSAMYEIIGACHCRNVRIRASLSRPPRDYFPRRCDCSFCSKQAAAYVSDASGQFTVQLIDAARIKRYRQGSKLAEFLFCDCCGVLVGAFREFEERLSGSLNARLCAPRSPFGPEQLAGTPPLRDSDKIARWKEVWFREVRILLGREACIQRSTDPDSYYWR